MADLRTSVTIEDIQKAARKIAERVHPRKIVLYGSRAYGSPTSDSDVDLLVIMETPLSNVEQAVEIRKAVDFPFPVDLLVRTPEEVARRLEMGDQFLHEVLTQGKVLYESTDR